MSVRTGGERLKEFADAMRSVEKGGVKKRISDRSAAEITRLKKTIKLMERNIKEPMLKVRLRKDHSFGYTTVSHFEVAYGLTADKTSEMSVSDFHRLVRNNAPIALSYSSSIILIGHPYDF